MLPGGCPVNFQSHELPASSNIHRRLSLQVPVYLCLLDIASGMQYLHSLGIMHSGGVGSKMGGLRIKVVTHKARSHQRSVFNAASSCPPARTPADLKPANVLLKGARNSKRGFICKLADFGLSRWVGVGWLLLAAAGTKPPLLRFRGSLFCEPSFSGCRMLDGCATHVETGSLGTPTHAAPELLREGHLSPAADVFAFGVLGEQQRLRRRLCC